MSPWKIYWGFSAWPNHTRRKRTTWKSIKRNNIEQQQDREKKEENYISDIKNIGGEEEEWNISEIKESVEDIMNISDELDDQMSNIINDINYSI